MELNAALVLRLIDRLSSPARRAAGSLLSVSRAERDIGKASAESAKGVAKAGTALDVLAKAGDRSTKAQRAAGRSMSILSRDTLNLSRTQEEGARTLERLTRSTGDAARANEQLERSEERVASAATRRFSTMEKLQLRGRAAMRMLGGEEQKLNDKLGKLAMLSLATDGIGRAGNAILRPLEHSVAEQAKFARTMTGIGIVGDLDDKQLVGVQRNIFTNARQLGLPAEMVQQDDMAVLNEGVYRRPRDLNLASKAAARISLLADIDGSTLSGPEAGAMISTYAHTLSLPADQLDRNNAMMFRASQLGGDKIGDVARFMPTVMAQMKGRDFGNQRGFTDVLAAFQIVKRVAGTDEAAGVDLQDLLANLNHRLTKKRFKKIGVNLDDLIVHAEERGKSPLEALADVLKEHAPKDPKRMAGYLGELFQNQQAGQAAMALIQYRQDGAQGIGWDTLRRKIAQPEAQTNYEGAVNRASGGPWADYTNYGTAKTQLSVSTGALLAPATTVMAKVASAAADALSRLEERHRTLGQAAAITVGGVGLFAKGLAGLGQAALGILAPMYISRSLFGRIIPLALRGALGSVLEFSAGAIPAVLAFSAALLTNPITWVVAGIAGLAIAGFLIVKHWSAVKAWIGGFWAWLTKSAGDALGAVARFFNLNTPPWLGKVAAIAAAGLIGGPLAAVGAAVAASAPGGRPPAAAGAPGAPRSGAPAPAAGPAAKPPVVQHITQHFHGVKAKDDKTLARELHKVGADGQDRALHDGDLH